MIWLNNTHEVLYGTAVTFYNKKIFLSSVTSVSSVVNDFELETWNGISA